MVDSGKQTGICLYDWLEKHRRFLPISTLYHRLAHILKPCSYTIYDFSLTRQPTSLKEEGKVTEA